MFITILLTAAIVIFLLAGFIFAILPVFPGVIFTLGAVGIFVVWRGYEAIGAFSFWLIVALGFFYFFVDWIAGIIGAKKFGASKFGVLGVILGGILGPLALGFPGLIIGPVLGGFTLEFFANRDLKRSLRLSQGALVGFILGTFGKLLIAAIITFIFVWSIFA